MAAKSILEDIRKNQIIEAALRVVARQGYYNLNMELVAKEARMSKGGIAHYFKSKKDLFKAVFVRFFETIFIRSQNTLGRIKDPIEKLVSFVWLYDWNDKDVFTGYPILFDFMSIASRDEDYKEIFTSWIESWIQLLKGCLIEAKDMGILNPQMNEDDVARVISALYQGIGERWFLSPDRHSTNWAKSFLRQGVYGLIGPYLLKKIETKEVRDGNFSIN